MSQNEQQQTGCPLCAAGSGIKKSLGCLFKEPGSKKLRLRKILLALFVIGLLVASVLSFESYRFLNTAPEDPGRVIAFEINPGDSFDKIANRLNNAGVISSVNKFKLYARIKGHASNIQAGVFEVSTGWTPPEVLHQLVYGKPTLERLTIREGLPWWEVAKIVEKQGFARAEDFKEIIHDPEFLQEMGIPFNSAEGFLYPDTYFLRKPPKEITKDDARKLAARMINTFWQKSAKVWGPTRPSDEELRGLVILASMVEKETGVADERARVAGVFTNRLRINMPMQCDPTIIYGLGENFNGNLRDPDMKDASNPYNTYKHPGLPPGPICSPGHASLEAAFNPEQHGYRYFVATGKDGRHYFNKEYDDHKRDIAKYHQELRRQRLAQAQENTAKPDQSVSDNSTAMPETSNATSESSNSTVMPEDANATSEQTNATGLNNFDNATTDAANNSEANATKPDSNITNSTSIELIGEKLELSQNATTE